VAMQLLHAEIKQVSIWKLWAPFLLIALPAMAITAALAVLFEMLPLLNGGVGNVVYFFVWTLGLAGSIQLGATEPTGIQLLFRSTRSALLKIDPNNKDSFSLTIGGTRAVRTFLWNGFDWTAPIVLSRVMWMYVAVGIALLASLFFHRFDPASELWRKKKRAELVIAPANGEMPQRPSTGSRSVQTAQLTPLAATRNSRFLQLVLCELRLMLKGQRWWWYAGAAGLLIGTLVSPSADAREGCLIAAWFWPILIWSQMGAREARYATQSLIFSSPRALPRQLPAIWMAGVLVAALAGAGAGVRLLMSDDWHGLLGWLAGALFIPSLALALGVWSGRSKAFEALYTVWWYIGPLHHTAGWDFMGTTPASSSSMAYILAAAALLATAYIGRRVRLGYA